MIERGAPRRLVVLVPNPLGDAVLATPALRALRRTLPDTSIVWAGRRAAHQALAGLPDRDETMPLAGPPSTGWRGVRDAARRLAGLRADAALLLRNSTSSALAARMAGIPRRIGTALTFPRRRLLTDRVEVPLVSGRLAPRPMEDLYLDLVRPLGVPDVEPERPRVVAEPFDVERALRRVAAAGFGADEAFLFVQPGAAFGESKRMPPARLADAVRALRAGRGLVPIVGAGPGEESLAHEVAGAIGAPCLRLGAHPADVGELKGLLARSAAYLGADAGPRHLAEALGVPTVVFLGPTDPRFSGRSRGLVVRREDLGCLGCHERRCPLGHHACLDELDPRRLVDAVEVALAGAPPRRGYNPAP